MTAAPATNTRCSCERDTEYHVDMSRIRPQCLAANPSDRSAQADVLLRQEPEEEEEDDGTEDDDDEDAADDGYSE